MDTKNDEQLAFVNALKAVDYEKEYRQALRDLAEAMFDMTDEEMMETEEKRNYLVYDRYIIPVELHYYGITDDLKRRYKNYKDTSLQQYIDEYGWNNINTTIVAEGLTRKEAELLEDQLIREGWEKGYCINKQGSGGKSRDKSEYDKEYRKEHKEEREQYRKLHKEEESKRRKQYYQDHKEEERERNKKYCENHKDSIKEYQKKWYQDHKTEILEQKKQRYQCKKDIQNGSLNNEVKSVENDTK